MLEGEVRWGFHVARVHRDGATVCRSLSTGQATCFQSRSLVLFVCSMTCMTSDAVFKHVLRGDVRPFHLRVLYATCHVPHATCVKSISVGYVRASFFIGRCFSFEAISYATVQKERSDTQAASLTRGVSD